MFLQCTNIDNLGESYGLALFRSR